MDAEKVIAWAREHVPEYGGDRATLFVAGSSAGGHLATLAALTPNNPAPQPGFAEPLVDGIEAFAAWVRSRTRVDAQLEIPPRERGIPMTQTITTGRTTARRPGLRNTTTLLCAATVALAGWVLSVQVAGVDLTVGSGDATQTVGPVSVAVTPVLAGGAAWALLALLDKRSRTGRRTWRIIACAVLALSLLGPVSSSAAGGVLATLVGMHLAVGATIIFGLAPVSRRRAPRD